ncbi:hypothetical protein MRB53_039160 [Persea americana]|nr:hypothetical protein MRB53_039160 [Persea americana]
MLNPKALCVIASSSFLLVGAHKVRQIKDNLKKGIDLAGRGEWQPTLVVEQGCQPSLPVDINGIHYTDKEREAACALDAKKSYILWLKDNDETLIAVSYTDSSNAPEPNFVSESLKHSVSKSDFKDSPTTRALIEYDYGHVLGNQKCWACDDEIAQDMVNDLWTIFRTVLKQPTVRFQAAQLCAIDRCRCYSIGKPILYLFSDSIVTKSGVSVNPIQSGLMPHFSGYLFRSCALHIRAPVVPSGSGNVISRSHRAQDVDSLSTISDPRHKAED